MVISDKLKGKSNHRRRGASATELAIILPLFITIILGCIDFARFTYTQIALANAVRAGGAWAMMNQPSNLANPAVAPPTSWTNSVQTAVSNEMSLQPGFQSGSLLFPSSGNPSPKYESGSSGPWQFQITATYPFQTIINWVGIPHTMTIGQTVTMRGIR